MTPLSDPPSSNRPRRRRRPLAALALSLLATAAALELALRAGLADRLLFRAALAASDRSPAGYRFAEERLHPWSRQAADPLRVAVIGDSFTLGAGVQPDDTYAARLERLLNANAAARPAEVTVYGACGTSTDMQFGFLKQALARPSHLVILGICLNDAENWGRADELMRWRAELMPRPLPRLAQAAVRHSRLAFWIRTLADRVRLRRASLRYYQRLYDPGYSGWQQMSRALELFQNDCRNEDVPCVALIFPLLADPFARGRYPYEFVHAAIRRRLTELGMPHVDLLDVLRGAAPARMQAIPNLDPHPSEICHRIAADTLLSFLLDKGYLDPSYRLGPDAGPWQAIWKQTADRMDGPP